MAVAKAQTLIAGGRKTKQGIVPMVNRQNGFGVVSSHGVKNKNYINDIRLGALANTIGIRYPHYRYNRAKTTKLNAAFTISKYKQNCLIKLADNSRRCNKILARNIPNT